jgi:prolyl 4-hydroxylase
MRVLIPGRDRPYLDGDTLDYSKPLAFTLDNVLTGGECASLIDRIETLGPAAAPITTAAGFVMRPDIRNNERVMFDDVPLAKDLFDRVAAHMPSPLCNMQPVGANERFRCYRYTPGQRFAPHYDGAYERNETERSLLTLIVYLNEGFEGGETGFLDYDVTAIPRTGSALLFQHYMLHEGVSVRSGTKYVLRSDVMYRGS